LAIAEKAKPKQNLVLHLEVKYLKAGHESLFVFLIGSSAQIH
jgi:hypothetical protein